MSNMETLDLKGEVSYDLWVLSACLRHSPGFLEKVEGADLNNTIARATLYGVLVENILEAVDDALPATCFVGDIAEELVEKIGHSTPKDSKNPRELLETEGFIKEFIEVFKCYKAGDEDDSDSDEDAGES